MKYSLLIQLTTYSSLTLGAVASFSGHRHNVRHPGIFRRAVSSDGTCGYTGSGSQGLTCPSDTPCCSPYGWCGSTTDHCGTGCQSTYGTCGTGSTSSAASGAVSSSAAASSVASGSTSGGATLGGVSTDGQCGPTGNNQVCPTGQCCSPSGWCGVGSAYCNSPDCQFNYGPGCDANKVPSGASTESISRLAKGSVLVGGSGIFPCAKTGTFALTFDDGPGDPTSQLLDLLDQYGAKATFFMTGINNGKGQIDDPSTPWPAVIKRMYASNHQLASHTWSHADLSTLTQAQRKAEMVKLEMAVRNILGVIPTYMRPPYSSCTDASGCPADMSALGYHVTYFDFDTQDYLHTTPDLIQQSKDVVDQLLTKRSPSTGNYLSIAHDIHLQTVANLTAYMLPKLVAQGWKLVTVGECLNDPMENWYRSADGLSVAAISSSSTSSTASSSTVSSSKSSTTTSSKLSTTTTTSSKSTTTTTTHKTTTTTTPKTTSKTTTTTTPKSTTKTTTKSSSTTKTTTGQGQSTATNLVDGIVGLIGDIFGNIRNGF